MSPRNRMFALYILLQPWRWRWLPLTPMGCALVPVAALIMWYEPLTLKLVVGGVYALVAYVRTYHRALTILNDMPRQRDAAIAELERDLGM